jgi:predicted nucleic acid-binding protein
VRLWVADTSPLIFLSKLGRLDLLRRSAAKVLIPEAVLREIREEPDESTSQIETAVESWLQVRPVEDLKVIESLRADLDSGEAEVIALALQTQAERVVMDDLSGRRRAHRLGLDLVGTLGLLLAAWERGELSRLGEEIERLRQHGFRVSQGFLQAVLQESGEL